MVHCGYRQLYYTDDIEVHICSNLYIDNEEDTPIELYV